MSPAVNLALEEVPFAILEVVKARILANRRRLGVGQGEQKPPPSLKPRPQLRKFGASSKNYRRPEPAATGGGIALHNILWIAQKQSSTQTSLRIFSGDAASSKDLVLNLLPTPSLPVNVFLPTTFRAAFADISVLPLSNKAAIVIVSFACVAQSQYIEDPFVYPYFIVTPFANSKVEKRAYYVDQQSVKEISLPQAVKAVVNPVIYLPPPIFAVFTTPSRASFVFTHADPLRLGYSCAKFDDIKTNFYFDDPTINYYRVAGPGSFALFGNPAAAIAIGDFSPNPPEEVWQQDLIYNFINSSSLPSITLSIASLDPTGATSIRFAGEYPPTGRTPVYGPVDGVENPVWRKVGTNRNFATRPVDPYADHPEGEFSEMIPTFYWDWGKPSYCRQRALQLGFTETDLTP